jgi:hypothetical protein
VRFPLCWAGLLLSAACQPNTGRPVYGPLPQSAGTEIRLSPSEATKQLAAALRADSVPLKKVLLRDGYLETGWFDAKSGRPRAQARGSAVELDRQVPAKHPVAVKVEAILQQLVKRFGGPPPPQAAPQAPSPTAASPAPDDQ